MKLLLRVLVVMPMIVAFGWAGTITLGIVPVSQTIPPAGSASVDITISGLDAGVAPSLSVYDLSVSYNSSILGFSSLAFGDSVLGDQLDLSGFGTITIVDSSVPGVIQFSEISFDLPATLDSQQLDAFTLATITFTGIGGGISPLSLTVNSLGDSIGDPLTVDPANIGSGSVTVTGSTSIPEPATFIPVGVGLLLLGACRRRLVS